MGGRLAGAETTSRAPVATGYWLTYGGSDIMIEYASLTGDADAIGALIAVGKQSLRYPKSNRRTYWTSEGISGVMFLLSSNPDYIRREIRRNQRFFAFRGKPRKHYSAAEWDRAAGDLRGKIYNRNGASIAFPQAVYLLYVMNALDAARERGVKIDLP